MRPGTQVGLIVFASFLLLSSDELTIMERMRNASSAVVSCAKYDDEGASAPLGDTLPPIRRSSTRQFLDKVTQIKRFRKY